MRTKEYVDNKLRIRDEVYGVVTSICRKGIFLELENGQSAFAYFGGLEVGDTVLCSLLRKATDTRKMLVAIDSVLKEDCLAA